MIAGLLVVICVAQAPLGQQLVPVEILYEEAMTAMEAGEWAEAASRLETILSDEPSHVPTRFNLAVCLSELGETDRAVEEYRKVLDQDGTLFEARMNLAILYQEVSRIEEAVAQLAAAAVLRPDDPVPVFYRAQLLDQSGLAAEAERAYRQLLALDPQSGEARRRFGFFLLDEGRGAESYDILLEAERLGTQAPAVAVALGDHEFGQGLLDEARAHYESALELNAGDTDIRLRLGFVLHDMGDFPGAIGLLRNLPDGRAALADAYLETDDCENAAGVYEELIVDEPDNEHYLFELGRCYLSLRRFGPAVPALERSLRLNPERAAGWGALAMVYYRQEDWARAVEVLAKDVELRPDYAPSHYALATSHDRMRNYALALVHYNKFLEFDDGSDDVRTFQVEQRIKALQ